MRLTTACRLEGGGSAAADIVHGVLKQLEAQPLLRESAVQLLLVPVRMVFREEIGLRERHHAEDAPGWIAKSGNRMKRTVRIGREFLHTVIAHLFVYREFHGDLHPGNILVDDTQRLHFIDWGNTVDISSIWKPAIMYLQAVLTGDADSIADAIIQMGEDRQRLAASRRELVRVIEKTLGDAAIAPLGYDFLLTLYREGQEGWLRRAELALNLATAITRQGIVIRSDYMHLTRSLTAMVGSYLGIYRDVPRTQMIQDILQVCLQFPTLEGMRQLSAYRKRLVRNLLQDSPRSLVPLPGRN